MVSPIGIMPEPLLTRDKRPDALLWLIAQPLPGPYKVQLWQGWAALVGSGVAPRDLALLDDSTPE